MNKRKDKENRIRHELTICAARLMAEEGISDYYTAKRKAAERLGVSSTQNMPRNSEIELALSEHQRLFRGHVQPAHLKKLREMALKAMQFLLPLNPHLVGPVLRGTADTHSCINIHVFTDTPEEVGFLLMNDNIPYELNDKRFNQLKGMADTYPCYQFIAEDTEIELTVFSVNGIRQAPPSPVDGKPMERASIKTVLELLANS